MIQNIAIIGINRKEAYEVSKILASELDMHFFDCLELFEFDNLPRTFTQILTEYGEEYYRKKEKGLIAYASGFENCVINMDSGVIETEENIVKIKETCLLIYLHKPASKIKKTLEKEKYVSEQESLFYNINNERLKNRIKILKDSAHIKVVAEGGGLKIASDVIQKIKEYYKINL